MEAADRGLDAHEQRVLGVLLEKEQTTPDGYPMTINAVIAGCNQKTNRDPVCEMTETEVVEALDRLRAAVLAWRTDGPRAEKWEHSVTRRWHLLAPRKALLTLLLLRGPQTPGELKTRSSRLARFDDVAHVEATLREMSEGPEALVRELSREPGQRGRRWKHLLAAGDDPPLEPAVPSPAPAEARPDPPPPTSDRLGALEARVAAMSAEIATMRNAVQHLQEELGLAEDDDASRPDDSVEP